VNMQQIPAGAYAYHLRIESCEDFTVTESMGGNYGQALHVVNSVSRHFLLDGFTAMSSPLHPNRTVFAKQDEILALELVMIGAN